MSIRCGLVAVAIVLAWNSPAAAEAGFADVVLDFFDSGAGPIAGPYGGVFEISGPEPVSLDVVLGSDGANPDFLSLPTGSFVIVGFTDELVFDRPGDDIFIQEVGCRSETADVFVSSDGTNFTFLGTADDCASTSLDLFSIGFGGTVVAVKIVGNNLGTSGSPGFDVANVQIPQLAVEVPALTPVGYALLASIMILSVATGFPRRPTRRCS